MLSLQLAVWLSCHNVNDKKLNKMILHFGNNNHSAISELGRCGYTNVVQIFIIISFSLWVWTSIITSRQSKGFWRCAVKLKHAGMLDLHRCVGRTHTGICAVDLTYWYIGHTHICAVDLTYWYILHTRTCSWPDILVYWTVCVGLIYYSCLKVLCIRTYVCISRHMNKKVNSLWYYKTRNSVI